MKDTFRFAKACVLERDEYVKGIWKITNDIFYGRVGDDDRLCTDIRVVAENLLIMYDQARDRAHEAEKKLLEINKTISDMLDSNPEFEPLLNKIKSII